MRFSLKWLLLLIGFAALACAALSSASQFWIFSTGTLTLVAVIASGIVATVDRGARQAFAAGFFICASINWVAANANGNPPVEMLSKSLSEHFAGDRWVSSDGKILGRIEAERLATANSSLTWTVLSDYTREIGSKLIVFATGLIGGGFALVIYNQNQRP
jgi:hypothetical protein